MLKSDHLKQDFRNIMVFSRRWSSACRSWIFNCRVATVPSGKLDWLGVDMCHFLVFQELWHSYHISGWMWHIFRRFEGRPSCSHIRAGGQVAYGWMAQWVFFVLMCYGKALKINCHQPKVRKASFSHLFFLIFLVDIELTVLNSFLLAYNFLLQY